MPIKTFKLFELKEEHLKLLSNIFFSDYNSAYFPDLIQQNPKKPYGNSDMESDIAKVLNIFPEEETVYAPGITEPKFSDAQLDLIYNMQKDMKTVLDIVLTLRTFKSGMYKKDDIGGKWEFIK